MGIIMQSNLLLWSPVLGALPRMAHYRNVLAATSTYFDRLRVVNEALGPHWVFRLADAVGLETIKTNRPSWHRFYVEDIDRLHCPLDPGAPETEAYLGRKYSDMDMAFYAGMGFDGYRLALQTQRLVNFETKQLMLDDRYVFNPSMELKERLDVYDRQHFIPKQDYYVAYGDALSVLYDNLLVKSADEGALESVAAGCLILLCGGHRGCNQHVTHEEEFSAQMESMIIFNHAKNVMLGITPLAQATAPRIHAVA